MRIHGPWNIQTNDNIDRPCSFLTVSVAFHEQTEEVISFGEVVKVTVADSESMVYFQEVFGPIPNSEEVFVEDSVVGDVSVMR